MIKMFVIPLLILLLVYYPFRSILNWLLYVIFSASYFTWLYITAAWGEYSCYLRNMYIIILGISIFLSCIFEVKREPTLLKKSMWLPRVLLIIISILQLIITSYFLNILKAPENEHGISLALPFKSSGTYYILHGGKNEAINYHYTELFQKQAIDIVKLNKLGATKRLFGSSPPLNEFEIYNEIVYSPLRGKVVKVVDDLIDQPYKSPDKDHLGNLVVIERQGVYVYLMHLKPGSIVVRSGDTVEQGQELARIGNSGNSFEPHLHMHAVRKENGTAISIPMYVEGRYLKRNDSIRIDGP